MTTATRCKPNVQITSDSESLARQAVGLFVATGLDAIRSRGRFCVAISGGRTPGRFFELLAIEPDARSLVWGKVHVFWADERHVPPDSPHSNYGLAARTFLGTVGLPAANVHRVKTEYRDVNDAALAYAQTLRETFNLHDGQMPEFDLVFLGMGADGHTASLLPGSDVTLNARDMVYAVRVPDGGFDRVTLSPPALLAARRLAVQVSGADKAVTLREVLLGEPDAGRYPIHVLWPVLNRIVWLVDVEAASLLVAE